MKSSRKIKYSIILLLSGVLFLTSGCLSNSKMSTYNFFAMDTIFAVTLSESDSDVADNIQNIAEELHSLFDIRDNDSDLAKINSNPNTYIEVNQLTYDLLKYSADIASKTDGFFDPTSGPVVELWDIETEIIPSDDDIKDSLKLVDYNILNFDNDNKSIMLSMEEAKIDLGAIAKGFAVKEELDLLKENNVESALISAGGCNYALGTKADGSLWKLGIQHPRKTNEIVGYLEISNMSVDTSGDYERFFMKDDIRYHHIIDLKSGYPAKGLSSVTVVTTDPIKADATATALFAMGLEKATQYIKSDNDLEAIIITDDLEIFVSSGIKDDFHPEEGIEVKYLY